MSSLRAAYHLRRKFSDLSWSSSILRSCASITASLPAAAFAQDSADARCSSATISSFAHLSQVDADLTAAIAALAIFCSRTMDPLAFPELPVNFGSRPRARC